MSTYYTHFTTYHVFLLPLHRIEYIQEHPVLITEDMLYMFLGHTHIFPSDYVSIAYTQKYGIERSYIYRI